MERRTKSMGNLNIAEIYYIIAIFSLVIQSSCAIYNTLHNKHTKK